jgi:hypothetical protein
MDNKKVDQHNNATPVTTAELLARVPPIPSYRGYGSDGGHTSGISGGRLRGALSKGLRRLSQALPYPGKLFGIGPDDIK